MPLKLNAMKRLDPLSWFMIYAIIGMSIVMFMRKPQGHSCKWKDCPYRGVTADNAHKSVSAYVGEVYTDAYYLDILHLQHPTEDYEQLEKRLFNNDKSK
jgi:hypothetical protein